MDRRKIIYLDDAIEAIFSEPLYESGMKKRDADAVVPAIYEKIKSLPSAQPEREKGEWVYNSPVTMKCNRCGLVIKDWDWHRFKICPNCGADMRGERDE